MMAEPQKKTLHGLYAITPDGLGKELLLVRVESALKGGARLVQYRDKICNSAAQRAEIARTLRALCHRFDASFIVNDDLALALAVDADGVHLGCDDGNLAVARQVLGQGKWLGASCYASFDLARAAVAAGADYVAFGAVFPSSTKPQAIQAPLSLFGRCRAELGVPACAIGGVDLNNAAELVAAGAELLAVITDLFGAPDIELHARALQLVFAGEQT